MTFTIRPFDLTDNEYDRIIEIHNTLWPDELDSVENVKYDDAIRNPDYFFQRLVIELDQPPESSEDRGKIIGISWCGEDPWSYEPGKYYFGFHVDPEFARLEYGQNGVAEAVMAYWLNLLKGRRPALKRLTTIWREDKGERVRFLQGQGFEQMMRHQDSELDVTTFDPAPFLEKAERLKDYGIEIWALSELQARDKDWLQRLYDMDMDIAPDEPMTGEFTPQPIEEYAKTFNHPSCLVDGWFVAVAGDRYVGSSNVWDNKANPQKLFTGFTGVRRSHRRKGVATALKLRAIEFIRRRGATSTVTGNEENNPMYQINLKLGFKPRPGWLEFHKEF